MSTERPDNDATDPVGGHAEGPVEGAAEDAVAGPPEGAVTDAAEDAAADPAERRAEDAAEGHTEDRTEGSAGDRAEDLAEGPAENQAEDQTEGSTGDRAEGSAEDAAEGSAENAVGGTVEGAAGATAPVTPGTVAGSGEETDESSGEGSAESPAGADTGASQSDGDDDGGVGDGEDSRAEHPDVSVPGPFADDGVGRAPRRRTPMAVASVVAAVLLVGGGGAYVAATASGGGRSGTPAADGTPPRLALDGYAAATTGNGSTGGTAGIAPGEPNPYGTTYRASGTLPAGPGSAHVRWAEGKVTRAEVARLAKALGLAGTPRLAGDAWTVGTAADGTEPNLRVTADAPGTWTFSSSLPGGDNCTKVTVCELMGSGSESDSPPGPVSEAAAERAAAPVLKAVGQDDAKLDASQLMNRVRVVNADPVVGGLPTYGWTTGLRIGPDGHVVGGSGQLKTPVEGDAYPVIGAKKTLDLMNGSASATGDRRMGIGGCASPVPLKDRDETPCEHPSPAPKAEAVTVEKATFGLAAQRANGRQALVPSWLFEVRSPGAQDTYTVTHPAVEPAFLASPESPAPPSADPTQSPGQPSSPAATRDVGVQGYTADGRDLTVSFTGGVCADYTVSASESSGKVTVTVTEKPWKNKVCIMIAKIYEKTVRLDEPLGGREVVGSDGKAVHHGRFGIPEPSAATSAGPR
ncbi:hypothetical protein [Streptomyces sp. NBC_00151]|uniref:hypothetical protein n=1 Tax=Streptomyces sp. NBC_00151 TaxID=2975669 RepID=UPI002DD7DE11|nr:hypothetical protein [Streptomyces sp. NBC_00151]